MERNVVAFGKEIEDKNGLRWSVKVAPDYVLKGQLEFLRRYPLDYGYEVGGSALYRCIRSGDQGKIIRISQEKSGELVLEGAIEKGEVPSVSGYVVEWLDADRDLGRFYEMAAADRLLSDAVAKYRGLHLVRIPDFFEGMIWAMIGQQINLSFAYTLKGRLVQRCGKKVTGFDRTCWLFPAPERVAALTAGEFTEMQFSRQKAEYIKEFAERVSRREINREQIEGMPNIEAMRQYLLAIKGVGPWTAEYVLMKTLGHPDAYPVGDAGLKNAVKIVLGRREKPSVKELADWGQGWENWKAYATLYLWRTLFSSE